MKIISHRGNVNGSERDLENNPEHIQSLLKAKIEVEIDVWLKNDQIFLGHDEPQYAIDYSFLQQHGLWCHAKNLEALSFMLLACVPNCFWHQEDDFTLTSSGFIWTYPNKKVLHNSIIVDNDPKWREKNYKCYGVCSDYI